MPPSSAPKSTTARDQGTPAGTAIAAVVASAGVGAFAGSLSGIVWGGIGGRIAMRVVLLTSDDRVRGVTSDDGFRIGEITAATLFLLVFTAILGAFAGSVCGLLRMVTAGPTWAVATATGIAAAAIGGSAIVHADGVDFRLLEPRWLTIGLFVLIPGMWGLSVVAVTERLVRSPAFASAVPALMHRRYWGGTGWIVLTLLTATGLRALAGDIAALR